LPTNVLDHDKVRDVEAEVIRALFERVKALEKQFEQLSDQSSLSTTELGDEPTDNPKSKNSDGMIEDFLDGAGI
ncbi:MAG: serine O-acetyltransferase, partial [Nostoc sp.]